MTAAVAEPLRRTVEWQSRYVTAEPTLTSSPPSLRQTSPQPFPCPFPCRKVTAQMYRGSSTQKAYDEAFLACSTAVYFESQVRCPKGTQAQIQASHADMFTCRVTNPKPYAHGRVPSTKFTTTMHTVPRPHRNDCPRRRRHWWTPCDSSNCSAKSE